MASPLWCMCMHSIHSQLIPFNYKAYYNYCTESMFSLENVLAYCTADVDVVRLWPYYGNYL